MTRGPRPRAVELRLQRRRLRLVDRDVGRDPPPPSRRRAARRRRITRDRPRRYFSVSLIATRWARFAAIRPMPRSVSSGRSPAVPMIAVIGAARPAPPAAIPSATSRTAEIAGLVVGEVDDDDPRPEPEQVEPSGRAVGRGAEVDEAVGDLRDRRARGRVPPPAAASAFATLCRASPPIVIGIRAASTIFVTDVPDASMSQPSRTRYARPPFATWRRTRGGPWPCAPARRTPRSRGPDGPPPPRAGRRR